MSLGLRAWNCARVPDSVSVMVLGDGMAVKPVATFSTVTGTESCHDVSNVAICTVTLTVDVWPG
jgi:hypothetical protein